MTAPFTLPDLMTIWDISAGSPIAFDIPCRQVPKFMWPQYAFSGGIIQSHYQLSHWIDFDFNADVVDAAEHVEKSQFNLIASRYAIIIIGGVALKLDIAWVEDRFSNTDDYYCRAYCWRRQREILP